MKNYALFLFLFLIPSLAFANYAVERKDGSVVIIDESVTDLGMSLKNQGLDGLPVIKITDQDLPPIADRDYWTFNQVPIGPKLIVNAASKKSDTDAQTTQDNKKIVILQKLNITDDDFNVIVQAAADVLNGKSK